MWIPHQKEDPMSGPTREDVEAALLARTTEQLRQLVHAMADRFDRGQLLNLLTTVNNDCELKN
jgi:hypothetical protein